MWILVAGLILLAYYFGRYKREEHIDEQMESLKRSADWWRERYEAVKPKEQQDPWPK